MSIFTPFIIVSLMLLNYLLYRKKIYDKKLYITTSIFILIYTIVAISIYYINLHNGFEYGIIYGDLLGNHFCDEYKYYTDANILYNHLKSRKSPARPHFHLILLQRRALLRLMPGNPRRLSTYRFSSSVFPPAYPYLLCPVFTYTAHNRMRRICVFRSI